MLRIGIRDYLVKIVDNKPLYNDFVELYNEDDSKLTEIEDARKYIGQLVQCFNFTEQGKLYRMMLVELRDIKKVRDINFDKDSWEIEIFPIKVFEPYGKEKEDKWWLQYNKDQK